MVFTFQLTNESSITALTYILDQRNYLKRNGPYSIATYTVWHIIFHN